MSKMLQGNPTFQRAQQMAQGKNQQQLEQTAKNLCQQIGIDYNDALNQFNNQIPNMLNNVLGQNNNGINH